MRRLTFVPEVTLGHILQIVAFAVTLWATIRIHEYRIEALEKTTVRNSDTIAIISRAVDKLTTLQETSDRRWFFDARNTNSSWNLR